METYFRAISDITKANASRRKTESFLHDRMSGLMAGKSTELADRVSRVSVIFQPQLGLQLGQRHGWGSQWINHISPFDSPSPHYPGSLRSTVDTSAPPRHTALPSARTHT